VSADEGQGAFHHRQCPRCGAWLRPDITWFEDSVDAEVFARAGDLVQRADLFVSIGTSGAVWPAAGFAQQAQRGGARMVEINPEDNEASSLYGTRIRSAASTAIPALFPLRGPVTRP
jgi:NAD-dependent deacetylase